jgi:hypothetical protein
MLSQQNFYTEWMMPLLSPVEDFLIRSLGPLPTVLSRLCFVAELRTETGSYEHWGMAQMYGEEVAKNALSETHSRVWIELLRTPIRMIEHDLIEDECKEHRVERVFDELAAAAIPANKLGGSARHFQLIAETLVILRRKDPATRQAA